MWNYFIPNNNPAGDTNITTVGDILSITINVLMGGVFALGFISVAVGFVQIITSQGDPKATDKGFNSVKWGVIALLLAFFIIVIKTVIFNAIGVTGINNAPDF
jgi:hypothetical protein